MKKSVLLTFATWKVLILLLVENEEVGWVDDFSRGKDPIHRNFLSRKNGLLTV